MKHDFIWPYIIIQLSNPISSKYWFNQSSKISRLKVRCFFYIKIMYVNLKKSVHIFIFDATKIKIWRVWIQGLTLIHPLYKYNDLKIYKNICTYLSGQSILYEQNYYYFFHTCQTAISGRSKSTPANCQKQMLHLLQSTIDEFGLAEFWKKKVMPILLELSQHWKN